MKGERERTNHPSLSFFLLRKTKEFPLDITVILKLSLLDNMLRTILLCTEHTWQIINSVNYFRSKRIDYIGLRLCCRRLRIDQETVLLRERSRRKKYRYYSDAKNIQIIIIPRILRSLEQPYHTKCVEIMISPVTMCVCACNTENIFIARRQKNWQSHRAAFFPFLVAYTQHATCNSKTSVRDKRVECRRENIQVPSDRKYLKWTPSRIEMMLTVNPFPKRVGTTHYIDICGAVSKPA